MFEAEKEALEWARFPRIGPQRQRNSYEITEECKRQKIETKVQSLNLQAKV